MHALFSMGGILFWWLAGQVLSATPFERLRRPEVDGYHGGSAFQQWFPVFSSTSWPDGGIARGPSTSLCSAQDDPLFIESLSRPVFPHHGFFAQELPAPDAAHLSSWLVDAAALGAILLVFLKIIDHFKRKPSLEQELEKLLRQIRAELNQLRHEQSDHLAEVRGRVEGAHQRVDLLTHDLNNKLQRLPGEIVDLLHKTGVTPRGHHS